MMLLMGFLLRKKYFNEWAKKNHTKTINTQVNDGRRVKVCG